MHVQRQHSVYIPYTYIYADRTQSDRSGVNDGGDVGGVNVSAQSWRFIGSRAHALYKQRNDDRRRSRTIARVRRKESEMIPIVQI